MENKRDMFLYYICAFLSLIMILYTFYVGSPLSVTLSIINIILVVLFIILSFKFKLKDYKIAVPIIYISFYLILFVLMLLINNKSITYGLCNSYYITFILIGFTILNIYSLLSFETKKPIKK